MKRSLSTRTVVASVFCNNHCTLFVSDVFGLGSRSYLVMLAVLGFTM
jgi:hypothetical protein